MSTPSNPSDDPPRQGDDTLGGLESALDEALDETFPASDPINLHQWSELRKEHAKSKAAAAKDKPKSNAAEADPDRESVYLRGPTAYCA